MSNAGKRTIGDLIAVMAALRDPETGCPWDLEQDFRSIAPYTIEEAYEVADAIQRGDLADLKEELGDLLLQVVYHARMAEEAGAFDFGGVADGITVKMIRRHPHVFGTPEQRAAGMAKGAWERIKAEEKVEKAAERARLATGAAPAAGPFSPGGEREGAATNARSRHSTSRVLSDVPLGLPALTRAVKLQDKAARVGFDWPGLGPVFEKLKEELAELEHEIAAGDGIRPSGSDRLAEPDDTSGMARSAVAATVPDQEGLTPERAKIAEEFGDLLFVVANVARHLKIDPEAALRGASDKFCRRFSHIEARLAEQGRVPEQSDLAEMDKLWDEAKALERGDR